MVMSDPELPMMLSAQCHPLPQAALGVLERTRDCRHRGE